MKLRTVYHRRDIIVLGVSIHVHYVLLQPVLVQLGYHLLLELTVNVVVQIVFHRRGIIALLLPIPVHCVLQLPVLLQLD